MHPVYVSPSGDSGNSGWSCHSAAYSDIQSAVEAAPAGGVVVVCRGTYAESVTVDKSLTLAGKRGAVVDATGFGYGIGVTASWTTIRGLTVTNASGDDPDMPYDGIITAGFTDAGPVSADHVTIVHNVVKGNMGSGIDLNSTSYSVARDNIAVENGVGVNVADDLGAPAQGNVIAHNITNRNFGGCGIALADHTGAGVIGNVVRGNVSDDNGLSTPTAPDASAGSGVILASPIPGGIVKDNLIIGNEFHGNGHGGVVVHSHVPSTEGVPDSDFSGNRIVGNRIGTNNLRTDTSDLDTTGIYLGSATPMEISIHHNFIHDNAVGIFTAGDVTVHHWRNAFVRVTTRMAGVDTY
ncbi:MAG: right-handed parallel beta-helix repeat-containing protein [Nocardioides sp.]